MPTILSTSADRSAISPFGHAVRPHGVGELGADRLDRVQRVHRALHDHRQVLPPDRGHLLVGEAHHVAALEDHAAGGGLGWRHQELSDRKKQGRLAASGLADNAKELPGGEVEADLVHRLDRALLQEVLDRQVAHLEDGA
jgi:hypothetical protein